MKTALSTLALVLTLTSCVTYRLQPVVPQGTTMTPTPSETAEVTHEGVTVEVTAEWGSDVEFDVVVINRSDRPVELAGRPRLSSGDTLRWKDQRVLSTDLSSHWWGRHVVVWPHPFLFGATASRRSGTSVIIVRPYPFPWVPGVWWWYGGDDPLTVEPGDRFQFSVRGDAGRGRYYRLVVPIDGRDYEVFFERIREESAPFSNL